MSLQYVARKSLKVAGRTVQPGEIVPEAATWKNVKAWVNDGSLAVAVEVPEGTVENAELKTQIADLAERLAALECLVAGVNEEDGDVEGAAKPRAAGEIEPIDLDALDDITREKLDEHAIALGIEGAPKLGNKAAVATAINEALAKRETQP